MKTKTLFALSALVLGAASAQNPPAFWNTASLSGATYAVLDPKVEGNPNIVSKQQLDGIVAALRRDSAGAIKRRYPNAVIATDVNAPNTIKVTPVLTTPAALAPWAKMNVRMELQFPDSNRVVVGDNFSVLTLWQQGANAANYAYDQLTRKLP
ncbi:hypothetical protein [Deinococcus sp.]|uniref:hypothetical protein n=1 Tax=Deinococcus sp. TaxID=47478 RepID=UPI0025C0C46C|nr:hypothetical protein [Deinococcus sp.]